MSYPLLPRWLAAGRPAEVKPWAEQAQQYQPQDEFKHLFRQRSAIYRNARHAPGYTAAFIRLTLAWWHITRREAKAALTTLAQLSSEELPPKQRLEWHLLRALASQIDGNGEAALTLAQSGGLLQPFVIKGAALRPLLKQVEPPPDADPAFIERLLAALPVAPATDLTERELEVLRHLARGLTYAAAAQQLHVTENTIRTHIKHIYGKLGVNNRTQAINRAKARGGNLRGWLFWTRRASYPLG